MRARLVAGIVFLWACVAVVATSLNVSEQEQESQSAVPASALSGESGRSGSEAFADSYFDHSQHVGAGWSGMALPEVFRDCRGCHQFSPENPHSNPQVHCDECHQGSGKLQKDFAPKWQNDLSAYATRTSPAFRHYTHGMLECRQCHSYGEDVKDVFAHMPVQTGPAFCAKCHGQSVTAETVGKFRWFEGAAIESVAKASGLQGAFNKPADNAAYAKQLDSVFGGPAGGLNTVALPTGGNFDHADHINTGVGAAQGLDCAACHTDIKTAGAAEVGTGSIPSDGCKKCHVRDASGAAARAAKTAKTTDAQPLWSLGTFAHSDHYGFLNPGGQRKDNTSSAEGFAAIESKQCAACHTYAPAEPGFSERDFPFEGDSSKHTYADCVECHTVEGWQTGEKKGSTEVPPLHASNGGTGWRDCAACHELGKPDMAGRRPQEPVQRWTERTFVFEGQTHPHITTKGVEQGAERGDASLQKDCATCHRAVVPALPTRLIEKAFTHKTHLPAEATQEDCTTCHPSAKDSANSLALGGTDYRTYTLTSCATCHWGGEVTEQVEPKEKPRSRDVVAFPHGAHVQAGQSCSDCHQVAAEGRNVDTNPEALACNQCHKHEAVAGARPPERLLANEVASCIRCHHEDQGGTQVASVPPARGSELASTDERYTATQSVFAGFEDPQFHPAGSDCATCHTRKNKRGKFAPIRVPTVTDHLKASVSGTYHTDPARGGPAPQEWANCLRCHWKPVGLWTTKLQGAFGTAAEKQFREKPQSEATRRKFGNSFEGYPGTNQADG